MKIHPRDTTHQRDLPQSRRLGIDLGTTNTVAAVEGIPLPLAGESGRTTLPSTVSFLPNGETLVGSAAKRRRSVDPTNTIFSAKRIIGRTWDDPAVQAFSENYGFELADVEDGSVSIRTRCGPIHPIDVASLVLTHLVSQVAHDVSAIEETIITVPSGFDQRQRDATLRAAEKAGLSSTRLIDEPLAAAHAYAHVSNPVERACIYDFGGGTFDFSVVEWEDGFPRLLASETAVSVGGDNIDHMLASWVAAEVLSRYNWDLRSYGEVSMRLLAECERAKIRLCFFDETALDLGQVDPDCPVPFEGFLLRREDLDPIAESIARQTFAACDSALRDAALGPADLQAVFLVGGTTHLEKVRDCIETYFGKPGRYDLEPTEAVAIGASLAEEPSEGACP